MQINLREARYILAVVQAIVQETLPVEARTNECPECTGTILPADFAAQRDHLVWVSQAGDEVVVIIGCEGYWVVDPALVGIDSPNWQPADAGFEAEIREAFPDNC